MGIKLILKAVTFQDRNTLKKTYLIKVLKIVWLLL
jgi:hypothetical protein